MADKKDDSRDEVRGQRQRQEQQKTAPRLVMGRGPQTRPPMPAPTGVRDFVGGVMSGVTKPMAKQPAPAPMATTSPVSKPAPAPAPMVNRSPGPLPAPAPTPMATTSPVSKPAPAPAPMVNRSPGPLPAPAPMVNRSPGPLPAKTPMPGNGMPVGGGEMAMGGTMGAKPVNTAAAPGGWKKGGKVKTKCYAKGGSVRTSASSRGDGCATKGHTKGAMR